MTAHDDSGDKQPVSVRLALLERTVDAHDDAFKEEVFPRLTSLDLWRQRIVGGMAVLVAILVPVLVASLKYLVAGRSGNGP